MVSILVAAGYERVRLLDCRYRGLTKIDRTDSGLVYVLTIRIPSDRPN